MTSLAVLNDLVKVECFSTKHSNFKMLTSFSMTMTLIKISEFCIVRAIYLP